jgi:hypothetical protein
LYSRARSRRLFRPEHTPSVAFSSGLAQTETRHFHKAWLPAWQRHRLGAAREGT